MVAIVPVEEEATTRPLIINVFLFSPANCRCGVWAGGSLPPQIKTCISYSNEHSHNNNEFSVLHPVHTMYLPNQVQHRIAAV